VHRRTLISTPRRAARPSATLTASGVASASAHGQVTIKSAIARSAPSARELIDQPRKVSAESDDTTATNRPAMRSTSRSIGAFVDIASMLATSLPTRVSSPTAVARTSSGAATLRVPA